MIQEVKQDVVVEQPPEVVEEVVEPQGPSAEEQRAMDDGWMPLDKWTEAGNDARDHRSAREFNDRGELLRRISEQNKYIQRVNQGMDSLKAHHAKVFEASYGKAIQDLKAMHAKAVEDGDLNKADHVADQIANTKVQFAQAQQAAQVQTQQPNIALETWRERNKWYDENHEMRVFADAIGTSYAQNKQFQVTPEQVLEYVEKEVKARYMKKEEPKKEAAPNPVGSVQNSKRVVQSTTKLKKADLDENELKAMKNYVDFKLGTEAEYLAELEKIR